MAIGRSVLFCRTIEQAWGAQPRMIRLANVLVVDARNAQTETLRAALGSASYSVTAVTTANEARKFAAVEHPDLVLLVAEPGGNAGALALAADLKGPGATADIPVLLVADPVTPELCVQALEAGLDDVIAAGCATNELLARLRPLVRLATMHAELRLRASIARRFGVTARDRVFPGGSVVARPAVLVVGDNPTAIEAALAGDVDVVATENLFEAQDLLIQRNFDAAVVAFSDPQDAVLGFCGQVRHNPRLFNLPIVLLAADGLDAAEAYRSGANRVLEWAADPRLLRSVILTLVRRQQLRWTIRGAMGESLTDGTRDTETISYTGPFLETYLQDRLALATASGRHLAVVFFSAPSIEGVRRQFGNDAALHLTRQLGQWITGLLRAEDLVARTRRHEFCVVLPDTPLAEAEVVMHRIAGVLAYTDFAVHDVYQPVKVWVQVGATDAHDGDDLPGLLSRARLNLD